MSANSSSAGGARSTTSYRAGRVRSFWQRVTEGIQISDLWAQFQSEARTSYGLYSRDVDWEAVERGKRWKKPFRAAGALFWAMLMKLSPARRVLLLLAIAAMLFTSFQVETEHRSVVIVSMGILSPGVILLFLLLALELADRVTMKRDLEIARDIQRWLVPEKPPDVPGYDIAFLTRAANTVAGDYYDVILRPGAIRADDRILFVVADVAGKSIPAAMLMATFQASLRTLAVGNTSLAEIMAEMNRYACSNSQGGARFTTAFLAELNPATGEFSYVNAGHNVPILRRSSGAVYRPEVGGIPIGVLPTATYEVGTAQLGNGEWLVIFTDGVVEALNAKGEEYGEPELIRIIDRGSALAPAELLKNLLAGLDWFVGNTPQHDDMTCLLVKRN